MGEGWSDVAVAAPDVALSRETAPDLYRLTRHGALTVMVTILPEKLNDLRALLKTIGDSVGEAGCPIEFDELKTVHFMRWIILDADPEKSLPASLVLSTNYDEPLTDHLEDVVRVAGKTLHDIYSHCEGYEGLGKLIGYLRKHELPYAAFYVGTVGRSVKLIKEEANLRFAIQEFLDDPAARTGTPDEIRDRIVGFVQAHPALNWACSPPTYWAWYIFNYWRPVLTLLVFVAAFVLAPLLFNIPWWVLPGLTLLAIALPLAVLALLVAVQEKRDAVDDIKNPVAKVKTLAEREDRLVQNQLSHLVSIKPQWFRRPALWVVLRNINILARYVFIRGSLGGIPTIHFARWVIIPGKRLLFFSNYDGSWENYLGDFIDKAAKGLTAVWSNTEGCPKATGLVSAGAKDEQRFKSWTRDHQVFTDVWYSAYPDLTVDNINNNSFIRIGLAGRLSPKKTEEWLARL
jgi:hypothetical protein